jgi:addiction module RelE/StbE family toxin
MAVEWSARARTDMRELRAYIAQDSPHYARRFVEKIFKAVETLTEHPQIGRKVPEADREDIRELLFQNYRIIYRTKAEQVYIVTVIHGSRNLAGQEKKPWEVV